MADQSPSPPPKPIWKRGHFWLTGAAFVTGMVIVSGVVPRSSWVFPVLTTISMLLGGAGYKFSYDDDPARPALTPPGSQ